MADYASTLTIHYGQVREVSGGLANLLVVDGHGTVWRLLLPADYLTAWAQQVRHHAGAESQQAMAERAAMYAGEVH